MRAYWRFYEPRSAAILYAAHQARSAWAPVVDALTSERIDELERGACALQGDAIVEGRWAPYVAHLREQGALYAQAGLTYRSWFDRTAVFRDAFHAQLSDFLAGDLTPEGLRFAATASRGLSCVHDLIVATVGEAYMGQRDVIVPRPAKPVPPRDLRAVGAPLLGLGAAVTGAASALPERADGRDRVLLVDDDGQLRSVIARTLRKAGFEIVDVDSGQSAITQLETGSFDVILSDVYMPDGTGLDLLRAVRMVDLDIPVILMTGTPDVDSATAAVEYGAFRYLTKPLDREVAGKILRHAARAHAVARLRRETLAVAGTHAGAVDRAGLEVRFAQALERVWMVFQPILDAKTGTLFGVEALLRSSEPTMPGPQQVLDAATELGLLPRLGRRVRSLSGAALASRTDGVNLFVNLHPEDLTDLDLVAAEAPLTQIAPRVILEITERASLASSPELAARLARLRALGFRIAIDDIGAGYSGLTSFTELMPEIVKIDMSLIRDVHASVLKQRTVRALCDLCHDVGCVVVGEGVETSDERDCLVALGCDLLQGYLLGRPARELPALERGR
jgi:EAL domain-containing protein (putative c-di-GMP-specific phosphodiesterase class I)/FixJ family two-component response regulator